MDIFSTKGVEILKLKIVIRMLLSVLTVTCLLLGCGRNHTENQHTDSAADREGTEMLMPGEDIMELAPGLSVVNFEGNDGFEQFLEQGGASSDEEVIEFLAGHLGKDTSGILFCGNPFAREIVCKELSYI